MSIYERIREEADDAKSKANKAQIVECSFVAVLP